MMSVRSLEPGYGAATPQLLWQGNMKLLQVHMSTSHEFHPFIFWRFSLRIIIVIIYSFPKFIIFCRNQMWQIQSHHDISLLTIGYHRFSPHRDLHDQLGSWGHGAWQKRLVLDQSRALILSAAGIASGAADWSFHGWNRWISLKDDHLSCRDFCWQVDLDLIWVTLIWSEL